MLPSNYQENKEKYRKIKCSFLARDRLDWSIFYSYAIVAIQIRSKIVIISIFVKTLIMRVVIETKDEYKSMLQEIATAIKAKITFEENEIDLWDELPEHVKAGILESQEQFKQGKFSPHQEVMAKYKTKYSL